MGNNKTIAAGDVTQVGEIMQNFKEDDGAIFVIPIDNDDLKGTILMQELPEIFKNYDEFKNLKFELQFQIKTLSSKSAVKIFEIVRHDGTRIVDFHHSEF
jgi:hypothetical protein